MEKKKRERNGGRQFRILDILKVQRKNKDLPPQTKQLIQSSSNSTGGMCDHGNNRERPVSQAWPQGVQGQSQILIVNQYLSIHDLLVQAMS